MSPDRSRPGKQAVLEVGEGRHSDVTSVLGAAFHDYPVMRFILGTDDEYDRRLLQLIGFFVTARFVRNDPVLAIGEADAFHGVATLTAPEERADSPEFDELRQAVWDDLGAGARERYAQLCDVWGGFWLRAPHVHVNMIGVLPAHQGKGYARALLDVVHERSQAHPASLGVSLTTEDPRNVPLYEHFGYKVTGHARVGGLETWNFFRARS